MLIPQSYRRGNQVPEGEKAGKRVEKGLRDRRSPFDVPLPGKNIGSFNSDFWL